MEANTVGPINTPRQQYYRQYRAPTRLGSAIHPLLVQSYPSGMSSNHPALPRLREIIQRGERDLQSILSGALPEMGHQYYALKRRGRVPAGTISAVSTAYLASLLVKGPNQYSTCQACPFLSGQWTSGPGMSHADPTARWVLVFDFFVNPLASNALHQGVEIFL